MTGHCPQYIENIPVRIRRGDNVSNHRCPTCSTPLTGVTAGRAKGRYLCPIDNCIVTLGLTGVQLDGPHRLVFQPGRLPDGPPGDARSEPDSREQQKLDRVAGCVLGTGSVVDRGYDPTCSYTDFAGLRLELAVNADPVNLIVNEPVSYRRCAACGSQGRQACGTWVS
ncbi:hypothetical protein ACWDG9_16130 [Streptomyces sp. NPDC001073]